jgi:hypothetical protein
MVAGACGGPAAPEAVPDEAGPPLSTGGAPVGLAVDDDGSIVRVTADGQVAPFTDRSDRLTSRREAALVARAWCEPGPTCRCGSASP